VNDISENDGMENDSHFIREFDSVTDYTNKERLKSRERQNQRDRECMKLHSNL
jgi:hypothetical protein